MAQLLRALSPVVTVLVQILLLVAPVYMWLYGQVYRLYKLAPTNVLQMVFGAALCFFGGTFTASIAAIEAFRQMGFKRTLEDLHEVMQVYALVQAASIKDDAVDADADGIADVDQIPPAELAKRKVKLALVTVKEPAKLQMALGSLWAAYLAVLATLKLQFAQTTAIALGIAEMVKFPIVRALGPLLAAGLGKDLQHWGNTIVDTSINFIAILFAWYLQMIISAFYSGLRGGKMLSDGLFALLCEHGILDKAPGWIIKQPFNPDESCLDEIVMYIFFVAGFVYQLTSGFDIPFPVNIILLPVTVVEWVLRWQVTFGAIPTSG